MTTPHADFDPQLDHAAALRWPARAAAHLLGLGLVAAVLAALPVAPSDLDRHQLPKETTVHIVVWLAVLLARPGRPLGLRPGATWALALFVAWSVAAATTALNPWLALRGVTLTITGAAAFITTRHLAARGAAAILLGWVAAAGVIGSVTGLAQAYGVRHPLFAAARSPGGTFGNRNFVAHFATITLPVMVTLALTVRRTWLALLVAIGMTAPVIMIVLSRSRAAWLGALAVAGVLAGVLLLARRRGTPPIGARIALLTGAVVVATIVAISVPNTLRWRADSPYAETIAGLANHREGSGRGRMLQYRHTLRLAASHPVLGVGPGNWPIRYGDVAPSDDPSWSRGDVIPLNPWPSSDWMALLSERGVATVLFALVLGGAIMWRGWRAMRVGGQRMIAGAGVIATLLAVAIQGSFDAVLLLPAPLLVTSLAVGALLDRADGDALWSGGAAARPRALWWRAVLLVLGAGMARSVQQTAAYVVAGDGRQLRRLVWAARVDPGSYSIRVALASREPCRDARDDAEAVIRMAPDWPSARIAARRCGVR